MLSSCYYFSELVVEAPHLDGSVTKRNDDDFVSFGSSLYAGFAAVCVLRNPSSERCLPCKKTLSLINTAKGELI